MSLPPDLRVLCARLTSTHPSDLPRLLPTLVNHVLRCQATLSAPVEPKNSKSSEASVLVHKLKTQLSTLLTGKSPQGRFAAVALVKTVVDVGGRECLEPSLKWVHGLLFILQKPDPLASKELCIITLTRIFTLVHGSPSLTKDIASPNLPSFATACLQLIKPPASGKPLKVPLSFVETVGHALSTLIPLFPTTLRPFAAQIRALFRGYIAPTWSDALTVPVGLREVSRKLFILIHYTVAKDGSSEEWAKSLSTRILDCHRTSDHVFRAVQEYWEPTAGYVRQSVPSGDEPQGGSESDDGLPAWSGLQAGAERLAGLLELIRAYFLYPTKAAVSVPVAAILDLISRISLIIPPSGSAGQEDGVQLNAAIGRDEKNELWSALPDIHIETMRLLLAMSQRLGSGLGPFSEKLLDDITRMYKSARSDPQVREAAFTLFSSLLRLSGPALSKTSVEPLNIVIRGCCRDILDAAGFLEDGKEKNTSAANGAAKNGTTNTDMFLKPGAAKNDALMARSGSLDADAALALLPLLLSHLPQRHLTTDVRGLLDRTAILSRSKEAMLASCLNPYVDRGGRYYPSILPFLIQQYPNDQEVEVLRSNLRSIAGGSAQSDWKMNSQLDTLLEEPEDEVPIRLMPETSSAVDTSSNAVDGEEKAIHPWSGEVVDTRPNRPSAPPPVAVAEEKLQQEDVDMDDALAEPLSPLKRKGEELEAVDSKRLDKGKEPEHTPAAEQPPEDPLPAAVETHEEGHSDSDSDESHELDIGIDDLISDEEDEGGEDE